MTIVYCIYRRLGSVVNFFFSSNASSVTAGAADAAVSSWSILAVDLFDENGELIGLQESHPISYYDVPMFNSTVETLYHLKDGNYFVDGLDNNEQMYDFDVRLSPRDFSPAALRRGN